MRRSSLIAVVAVLALGLAGGGVASAHQGGVGSGHHGPQQKAVTFRAHASPSVEQGGTLRIVAKVRHAPKAAVVTARATVNLPSGPVTVDLVLCGRGHTHLKVAGKGHGHGHHRRHGNVLKVRVPVAETETLGTVTIDVVFTLDGVDQAPIQLATEIVAPEPPPAP